MNRKLLYTVVIAICMMGFVNCSSTRPAVVNFPPVIAITPTSGNPQSHAVSGAFGTPLIVTVTTNGLPSSGVVVIFSAPTTGASGTFGNGASTATATSDENGLATAPMFTANGTAGSYIVTATASGASAVATFNLTNTIAAPSRIAITSGNSQSAGINSPFAPFVVTVTDSSGNRASGAIVTFMAPTSGASGLFANGQATETDTTGSTGVATSSTFTANGTSGPYTVTAAIGTGGASVSFSLTNGAGAPASITATGGLGQSTAINTAFSAPLVVTVLDASSNFVSGVAVTFTAPTTGASGVFANGQASDTITTDVNGNASATFTANGTTGNYTVTAAITGLTPVSFTLTNTLPSTTYVFYLSGQEAVTNFYALAGSVQIDANGNVLGGEQDFNDALGLTTFQGATGDTINPGTAALVVDATGQGTLTLNTSNTSLGVGGVETFGIQFVNSKHALIVEFDGFATSSGSLDLQTSASTVGDGGYAFTLSGLDVGLLPVDFGGVFTISGGTTMSSGLVDTNDAGTLTPQVALSGSLSAPDSLGRGTITSTLNYGGAPIVLDYYIVGPETLRIIDVDSTDTAIGSAFGQGVNATGASNASLGDSVFGIAGNVYSIYGAAGQFSTSTLTGLADDDEVSNAVLLPAQTIGVSYAVSSNGYGSLTLSNLGDIATLGLYLTDPNLNLLDPNNPASGTTSGGLIADMDPLLAGGTGIVLPQTDPQPASFTGNYAFGAQVIDGGFEFDFLGQGTVASDVLTGTGLVSDPLDDFLNLAGPMEYTAVPIAGTATPDPSNLGYYTMLSSNALTLTVNSTATPFDVVLYQASGTQLLWLNEDASSVFLGSLQQQASPLILPAARKGGGKAMARRK